MIFGLFNYYKNVWYLRHSEVGHRGLGVFGRVLQQPHQS
jgi:hypothetical protein